MLWFAQVIGNVQAYFQLLEISIMLVDYIKLKLKIFGRAFSEISTDLYKFIGNRKFGLNWQILPPEYL